MSSLESHASSHSNRWDDLGAVRWAARFSSALSILSLIALLLTIVVSVTARYVFSAPLLGSNEILQLCLVALISFAMLPAAHEDIHVRVDVLDHAIGKYGRFFGDLMTRAVTAVVLISLAYRMFKQAMDAAEFGDATNMLAIPLWPFYALIILGGALHAVMMLIQIVDLIGRGASEDV